MLAESILQNDGSLKVPFLHSKCDLLLLRAFPELTSKIIEFCNEAVAHGTLSTESLHLHLTKHLMVDVYNNEFKNLEEKPSMNEFLAVYNLKNICLNTAHRWLLHLGYSYDFNKKTYYTDGHERPDVVADRENRFLSAYFSLELYCHRWVHLTKDEVIKRKEDFPDFPMNPCYKFIVSKNGNITKMREYHMDTHRSLKLADHKPFEYRCSIRMPRNARPKIILGQDESSFHQYIFSS